MPEHLTGPALATALFEHGLAPAGTTKLEHADGPSYYLASGARWRPWVSWDHVAHLIERFEIDIRLGGEQPWLDAPEGDALATDFADIPAAIGNLSLQLHAQQQGGTS